jgi:hypothetical protein
MGRSVREGAAMTFGIAALVDAVIVFTLLECAALVAYHRFMGKGVPVRDFLANMVSGLCLMLALRCLARDAGGQWVAAFLLAAGAAHGIDLWLRWKHPAPRTQPARRMVAR